MSPCLDIYSVTIARIELNSLLIPISINRTEKETVEESALIDSGAGGRFMDKEYAKKMGFPVQKLEKPLIARNVDSTENKTGKITSFVELDLTIFG